ncbi:MAG: chitobiase/beta-hexosaminidase C-terminal domain-containing protein [Clostridia bacterium]|nr:chitobiase/beta-hexosaminidase C-terminal domain-containing protein [Clostridia bacterium]
MQKKHLATIFIVICTIILMCSVHTQASNYTLEIGQTMNVRVNQPNTSYPAVGGANYTYVWSITHYKAEGVDSLGLPKYVETRSNTVVKISSYSSTAMSNTITALAPGKARVSCKCTVTYNSMNPLYPMNSNIQTVPRSEQISVGTWDIIVNLNPTGVSIPTSISVNTNTSKTLTATLSPEGASSTLYWRSSNTSVATVNNGKVTGVYPGTATITVETKNGYKDTCTVTVTASSLKLSSTTPKSNATMVPIGETICFKYESSILEGWNSSYIGMFDNTSGQWVGISKRISGSYLYIIPTSPLVAEHSYTVTIPENAVVNTYGGGCVGGNSITFTTVDPNRAYKPVISLDKNIVTITAMNGEDIFYTLDGSNPATNGTLYNGPFKIELSQAIVTAVTAKNWKFGDSVTRVYDFAGYEVSHKSILGGSWDDQFLSVAPTSDGGYVASGNSYTTIAVHEGDWGKARCGSKKNGTIVKYNANGKIEWKALFGGEGNETFNSVATNGDGYVVVGYTANSYGTEGDLRNITGKGSTDALIVKYDNYGKVVWKKVFGGKDGDMFTDVVAVNDGYIAVGHSSAGSFNTGDFSGIKGKGSQDGIIVKFDLQGIVQWILTAGGKGYDLFYSIDATTDGGFIVSAEIPESSKGLADSNATLMKYNAYGVVEWTTSLGKDGQYAFNDVQETWDGYVAVGIHHGQNGIIAKYNHHGVLQSSNIVSNSWLYEVCVIGDKYVCPTYNHGSLAIFNSNCTLLYTESVAGKGYDNLMAIAPLQDGFVVVGAAGEKSESDKTDSLGNGFWKGFTNRGYRDSIVIKFKEFYKQTNGWG